MAVTLGSNISAISATRSLDRATSDISRTFERLSSGMRINRASDDAAGLAVSTSLTHYSKIFARADLNISDAMSVVSIADATLGEVGSLLGRMSELAYQAANGTYSRSQRKTLEAEFVKLDQEIRRIGSSTSFNGLDLLGGRMSARAATTFDLGGDYTVANASLDGRYVTSVDDTTGDLTLIDTLTGEQRRVADGATSSVESARVLQNGDVLFLDYSGNGDVFYWTRETGASRNITTGSSGLSAGITNFTVSDDGSTLAFISFANLVDGGGLNDRGGAHPGYEVWTMNIQAGIVRKIPNSATAYSLTASLQLSSDGSYIGISDPTTTTLLVANTTGTTISTREITLASSTLYGVTNSGIAYFRSSQDLTGQNPSTVNQIFSLSQADGARRQLTNFTGATNLGNVRLNGDGSTIYLTSTTNLTGDYSAGVRQVYSFDTNSPGFRRLTNFSSSPAGTLFLSRDGGRLFSTNGGNLDMYDVTLEGTSIDFEVGSGAAGNIAGTISALSSAIRGLGAFGLSSQLSARASLERISKNLEQLNSARGTLGALTSRLGSASNIVKSRRDEFLAAAGRIKDANMATETSNLIRQQILQQVGTSGLAQARRAPELALQLLR